MAKHSVTQTSRTLIFTGLAIRCGLRRWLGGLRLRLLCLRVGVWNRTYIGSRGKAIDLSSDGRCTLHVLENTCDWPRMVCWMDDDSIEQNTTIVFWKLFVGLIIGWPFDYCYPVIVFANVVVVVFKYTSLVFARLFKLWSMFGAR